MEKIKVEIYCDGSCPKPNGPGGWAYIMRITESEVERRDSGGTAMTTNNKMELGGLIAALKVLPKACSLTITSDSQYVINGINDWMKKWKGNGWKKYNHETKKMEEPANLVLWKELDELLKIHEYVGKWVRGHNGHPENEWCDEAAGLKTEEYKKEAGL